MIKDSNDNAYIVVFSRKLYKYLLKKNVFPYVIETNKKYPEYLVYKYKYSDYTLKVVENYRAGKLII